jgi:hypothetical protein
MAAIQATVLNDAIVMASESHEFKAFEGRLPQWQTLENAKDGIAGLMPKTTIEAVIKSERHPAKIPVLNKYGATVITVRSCTITPDIPVSAFAPIVFNTVGFTASISKSVNIDNYTSAVDELAWQFRMGWKAIFNNLEAQAVAYLEANKSAVNASAIYTITADAMRVPLAEKQDFYKNVPAILFRNDHFGRINDAANTEAMTLVDFIQNQGRGNSTNLQYQATPANFNFHRSNQVTNGAGVDETHYLYPIDTFGVLNWVDPDSRAGARINEGRLMTTMTDPIFGFNWGVYYYRECTDETAELVGLERTVKEFWEITADFSFNSSYSSDTSSPIYKAELLDT